MVIKMKKIGFIFIGALLVLSSVQSAQAAKAMQEEQTAQAEESFFNWIFDFSRHKGVAQVKNEQYEDECGACHFPYQPGLLPALSWEKIFDVKQMENHFGDNAELDEETRVNLLQFAVNNSADNSFFKRSRKIMASLDDNRYPNRITETPYIKEKHEDIPTKLVHDNAGVKSLSYCNNCHKKADKGIYDDDTVYIPGHGRW